MEKQRHAQNSYLLMTSLLCLLLGLATSMCSSDSDEEGATGRLTLLLVDTVEIGCQVYEHEDVIVVAEQATEAGTIILPEGAPLCDVAISD